MPRTGARAGIIAILISVGIVHSATGQTTGRKVKVSGGGISLPSADSYVAGDKLPKESKPAQLARIEFAGMIPVVNPTIGNELPWRLGLVAFFGLGQVADSFGDLDGDGVLPGGGIDLRFMLASQNHMNVRVDYAWGRDSSALYVGLLEAF